MRSLSFALLRVALALGASLPAQAVDCDGRQPVGYRVLALESGRKVAVWYPAAAPEQPMPYTPKHNGFAGNVARDAPPAACPRVPLLLFSHGWGGCALQSLFLTEELARAGYVVAAPDHADAVCRIGADELNLANLRLDKSFFDPASWNERSEIGRLHDLRAVIRLVAGDAALARIADTSRVGVAGHSLGGYAAVAMAGGWPTWKTAEVKAVLALSPYVLPFMTRGTLAQLQVPVMYQGAVLDLGITTSLEGAQGAYAQTPPPRVYARLNGGTHFEWTNWLCAGTANVAACLQARPNARLITEYSAAFFDHVLKGRPAGVLSSPGKGFSAYQVELAPRAAPGTVGT
jgi:predicted dienelactone hydrolase